MKPITRHVHDFFDNSYIAFIGSAASILSLIWFAYSELHPSPWTIVATFVTPLVFSVFLGVGIYSIKVRQENREFRNFAAILHRINHDYRDALSAVFRIKPPPPDLATAEYVKYLKEREATTIKSTCQKIAAFFSAFTHTKCTVTVKLMTQTNEKTYCSTYQRSEENCERDTWAPVEFEVNTGLNTALDEALKYAPGRLSHFFAADLAALEHYRNQRDNYLNLYRSLIVVPIRCINPEKIGTPAGSDDIGFLWVDTLSPYRLNDTWHVQLLAAFADQMYNFLSLMRGRYVLKKVTTTDGGAQPIFTCKDI